MIVPGSPSDLNIGNGTEVAMVCTGLGSLFYFLCSNLKANPVVMTDGTYCPSLPKIQMITSNVRMFQVKSTDTGLSTNVLVVDAGGTKGLDLSQQG